jgi:predicted RND superfamily exporter protein
MWDKIATFILKQRTLFLIAILAFTGVMGYYATKVQLEYQLQRLAPKNDPDLIAYNKFQKTFGMDHNKVVIGFSTNKLFELKLFNQYKQRIDRLNFLTTFFTAIIFFIILSQRWIHKCSKRLTAFSKAKTDSKTQ